MDGLLITPLKIVSTPRGDVRHGMKASDPGCQGFGEAYFSVVQPGMVKGWKRHRRMTMNVVVACGAIRFVVHDTREGSATEGQFREVLLSPEQPATYSRLTVPPMVWMAFQGVGEGLNLLLNIASIEHDPQEADNVPLETHNWAW